MADLTPEQLLQALATEAQTQARQHALECDAIVGVGRERHGSEAFDDAAKTVVDAIGATRKDEFMLMARQLDDPTGVVMHLANNPDQAKEFGTLPPHRMGGGLRAVPLAGARGVPTRSPAPQGPRRQGD